MKAILYQGTQAPREVPDHQLNLEEQTGFGFIGRLFRVGQLLDAEPSTIQVLGAGADFIIFHQLDQGAARNLVAE